MIVLKAVKPPKSIPDSAISTQYCKWGCQRFRPFSDLTLRGFGPEVSALFEFGPHI